MKNTYEIFQGKMITKNDLIELEIITNDVIRNLYQDHKKNGKINEVYYFLRRNFFQTMLSFTVIYHDELFGTELYHGFFLMI